MLAREEPETIGVAWKHKGATTRPARTGCPETTLDEKHTLQSSGAAIGTIMLIWQDLIQTWYKLKRTLNILSL